MKTTVSTEYDWKTCFGVNVVKNMPISSSISKRTVSIIKENVSIRILVLVLSLSVAMFLALSVIVISLCL